MFKKILILALAVAVSFAASAQKKKDKKKKGKAVETSIEVDAPVVKEIPEETIPATKKYNPMYTKTADLIHTAAEVKFNWDSAFIYGKATLTMKAYFAPISAVTLDANGMKINEVAVVQAKGKSPLKYNYDGKKLIINLDKSYTRNQEFKLFIDYVGMPDKLKKGGSLAINSDKGLYFVNKDGKNPNKPRQIWTQGETESNSSWLPTINGPQEKHTQELAITVPDEYVTVSNGLMQYSTVNADGTRTDLWKQDLPHATYLTMMAISKFAVVKDKWRDMEVNYYVDPEYEPYARLIFGKTTKMLECFSKTVGVDYPWDKYAQVVAHDYVSGAMENTSATLHGEFIQVDDREYLDAGDGNEDVISHELFHHWFGDLVTCESWANLSLNESFATYGEYLWEENEYGRDAADYIGQGDLTAYLRSPNTSEKTLFRPDYEDKEDMFDVVTYQKGGRVLYMLRRYLGDEAFYASLKLYLERFKFGNAEINDLRAVFEDISGEDLNWFFNQWYTKPGHPDLKIEYAWDDVAKVTNVTISQRQDVKASTLYRLPLDVDIYVNGAKTRQRIWVEKATEEFSFASVSKPNLINIDAEKMLLGTKEDVKTLEEWAFQYRNAPLYLDRYEAIDALLTQFKEDDAAQKVIMEALKDKFWNIRSLVLGKIKGLNVQNKAACYPVVMDMAQKDERAAVRAKAIGSLNTDYADKDNMAVFKKAISDPSYTVAAAAMRSIAKTNVPEAMTFAKASEASKSAAMRNVVAEVYAANGTLAENQFFLTALSKSTGFAGITLVNHYKTYLLRMDGATVKAGIDVLKKMHPDAQSFVKATIKNSINSIAKSYADQPDAEEVKQYAAARAAELK